MQEKSFWKKDLKQYDFPSLRENLDADIAIIGAGMAGILSAYLLSKNSNKKIVLLEADEILKESATAYTTAFITQIIDTATADLLKVYGKEEASQVLQSGRDAIDLIEYIVDSEKIDCGFMRCPVYIYASKQEQLEDLKKEKQAYDQLGIRAEMGKDQLSFKNFGYLRIQNQAKFHPLKFAQAVLDAAAKNGVQIFTKTKANEVKEDKHFTIKTEHGNIRAEKVIIATYQPFNNPKEVLLKKGMYKSYALEATLKDSALEPALYWDMENPYHYFRIDKYGDKTSIILGGEDHKSWFKIDEKKSFKALEEYLEQTITDNYEINYRWDGPILEPSDGLALIGQIRPSYYLASAFSGNGMTYSAISAMIFKNLSQGAQNPYPVYDPTRFNPTRWIKKAGDYLEEFFGGAGKNAFKQSGNE